MARTSRHALSVTTRRAILWGAVVIMASSSFLIATADLGERLHSANGGRRIGITGRLTEAAKGNRYQATMTPMGCHNGLISVGSSIRRKTFDAISALIALSLLIVNIQPFWRWIASCGSLT